MPGIYKRGSVYYLYYRLDGRRIRKRIGTSKKIAELALADVTVKIEKRQIGFSDPPKKRDHEIGAFFDEFKKFSQANHRPNTVRRYQAITDNFTAFLKTQPGISWLSHLSPRLFEAYKAYKREVPTAPNGTDSPKSKTRKKGAMPATINMEIQTLRTTFGLAVKWGLIEKNPVAGVKFVKVDDAKPARFLTADEAAKLLLASPARLRDIFAVFLYSGMRKGELLNLTWDDVGFARGVIKIQNKDWWVPKAGQREISMHHAVRDILTRIMNQANGQGRFVFPGPDGGPLKIKLREKLMRVAKHAGLANLTKLHSLRHSFGSNLVMAGVDLPTVQKEMGHASIETTMIYAHLTPQHRAQAVNRLKFGS